MSGPDSRTKRLERRVEVLDRALQTLIVWMAQSAASPISAEEAGKLLRILDAGAVD